MKLYIARDKDGSLWLYSKPPFKKCNTWYNMAHMRLDSDLFSEVKWEDEEPTEVELVIKKKI